MTGTAGPGKITVSLTGKNYDTGGTTGLGNTGSGLFARVDQVRQGNDESEGAGRTKTKVRFSLHLSAFFRRFTTARGPCPS